MLLSDPLVICPHWEKARVPFPKSWAPLGNIDQFRWLVRRDVQEQLAQAKAEIGIQRVRAVGMFDEEVRVLGPSPKTRSMRPTTNWQIVDYVIDSLLEIGLDPVITPTFMPPSLAAGNTTVFTTRANICLPRDWREWQSLIVALAQHLVSRYGRQRVRQWQFEIWNEPNLRDVFFVGDQDDFFRLWHNTFQALRQVDSSLQLGGPSTARGEWLTDFLFWTKRNDCSPDFLISHIYNNDGVNQALSPFGQEEYPARGASPFFAIQHIQQCQAEVRASGFKSRIEWNEWGRSWLPYDPDRETANEAAFAVHTMARLADQVDLIAPWCLSDVYDQAGYGAEAFYGGYGLLSLHGLRKPAYHAYVLLHRLGPKRVPVPTAALDTAGAIVCETASGDRWQALCYDFRPGEPPSAATPSREVRLALPAVISHPLHLRLTVVDSTENNVLARWHAEGAPAFPTPEALRRLRRDDPLMSSARPFSVVGQSVTFAMSPGSIALLEGTH